MIELLQKKNRGSIILINSGAFYVARGKDAVLLNQEIGLKANCMESEVCKVGFPLASIDKYTKLIEEKGYSYIIYNYDKKQEEINLLRKYKGKKLNEIETDKLNCYICKNTVKMYKKSDEYIQALAKFYEKEEEKIKEQERIEKEQSKLKMQKAGKLKWIIKHKKKID